MRVWVSLRSPRELEEIAGRAKPPVHVGTFLRRFTFGHVRELDAVAARLVVRLATEFFSSARSGSRHAYHPGPRRALISAPNSDGVRLVRWPSGVRRTRCTISRAPGLDTLFRRALHDPLPATA